MSRMRVKLTWPAEHGDRLPPMDGFGYRPDELKAHDAQCVGPAFPSQERLPFLFVFVIVDNTNRNWKDAVRNPILMSSKRFYLKGKTMNTAVMTSSSVSVPSFSGSKAAAKPGLSLREWLGILGSALAMASAVPATGRISAKHMARVRTVAESI